MTPKVLVMIPAYNEEKTVGEVVKSTLALFPNFKVIVIDDGSEDATAKNAREAGADVVSLPFHCGGSVVIQTGYQIATNGGYDYAVKIDADGQHKPEEIMKLLEPLINDEADMTAGSRYLRFSKNHTSAVRDGGIVFSSTLVSSFRKMEITDITSGMRAWSRKAIQTLMPNYMERGLIEDSVFWVVETLLASKKRLRLKEVPIEVLPREYGNSKSFSLDKMLLYPFMLIIPLIQKTRR
ncbi:glycosyltransferase family 2 protein [Candidatus Bathyarchaeota archaeon]|nr:MAG: glycosyltransferase family 2 protein [Candidatus Bathyarchaeota archaeon]